MSVKVKIEDRVVIINGLLAVAFVVLKLTGIIDWSWLWVTASFWWPIAIGAPFFVAWCAFHFCRFIYLEIKRRNSNKW